MRGCANTLNFRGASVYCSAPAPRAGVRRYRRRWDYGLDRQLFVRIFSKTRRGCTNFRLKLQPRNDV